MATQKRFIAKNGLDNNSNTITNVADPSGLQDAATKNYLSSNFVGTSSSAYPTVSPSLNLDFIGSRQLDSRITFARNSIATYYDGKTTALAEQNLFLQSQGAFSNTTYYTNLLGATVSDNTVTAPDGTLTASTFTASAQFSSIRSVLACPIGTYTLSIYAYRNSGANVMYVYTNGGILLGSYSPTSSWARYSFTFTLAAAENIYIIQDRVTSGYTPVYIWGAQLEQRSSVTSYTPTTTAVITNYIPVLMTAPANVARFDCDPITRNSLGLLIEESRTNLSTYSSDFSNAVWVKDATTVSSDTIVAPDGTLVGDKLIESTSTGIHRTYSTISGITAISYTFSVYVKYSGRQWIALQISGSTYFDLLNGVVGTSTSGSTGTITPVGNGWYRCSTTRTLGVGTVPLEIYLGNSNGGASYTGDGYSGIYIWGAQLEVGSFPTSYIPTVASTVTRAADAASMTGTNFSSWYNQSQGSLYAEADIFATTSNSLYARIAQIDGGATNTITLAKIGTSSSIYGEIKSNGTNIISTVASPVSIYSGIAFKAMIAYSNANIALFTAYGLTPLTGANGVAQSPFELTIGNHLNTSNYLNGHIRKLSYYPVALSSSNLVALTS